MKLLATLAISAFTLAATAAPVELTASTEGAGVLERSGAAAKFTKVNLVLKRDGKFSLGFVGEDSYMVSGRWQAADGDDVLLRISDAFGKDAAGTAQVNLRARRDGTFDLNKITLNGTNAKGQPMSARFTAGRQQPPPPPRPPVEPPKARIILDAERAGRGAFRTGGQAPIAINKVHVTLWDNGKAHVHTEGKAELRYEGTWAEGGIDTVTLDVKGGIKGERMRGAARHRNGRVGRVELSGTVDGTFYSVELDPFQ